MMEPAVEPLTALARALAPRRRGSPTSRTSPAPGSPPPRRPTPATGRATCAAGALRRGLARAARASRSGRFSRSARASTLGDARPPAPAAPVPRLLAVAPLRRGERGRLGPGVLLEAAGRLWPAGARARLPTASSPARAAPAGAAAHLSVRAAALLGRSAGPRGDGGRRSDRPARSPPDRRGRRSPTGSTCPAGARARRRGGSRAEGSGGELAGLPDGSAWPTASSRRLREAGREVVAVAPGAPGSGLARRFGRGALDARAGHERRLRRPGPRAARRGAAAPAGAPPVERRARTHPSFLRQRAAGTAGARLAPAREPRAPGPGASEAGRDEPVGIAVAASGPGGGWTASRSTPARAALPRRLQGDPRRSTRAWPAQRSTWRPPTWSAEPERLAERLLAERRRPAPASRRSPARAAALGAELRARAAGRRREAGCAPGAPTCSPTARTALGPALAEALLRHHRARVALLLPPGFPERPEWESLAAGGSGDDETARSVRRLLALESRARYWTARADLLDRDAVAAALAGARARSAGSTGSSTPPPRRRAASIQLKTPRDARRRPGAAGRGGADAALADALRGRRRRCGRLPAALLVDARDRRRLRPARHRRGAARSWTASPAPGRADAAAPFTRASHWDPYQWDGWLAGRARPGGGAVAGRGRET